MIPVTPVAEPADFESKARKPGRAWLDGNPHAKRPRDYWSAFRGTLADGFANRCGYGAMHEPAGTVDHFCSFHEARELAYEWTNYRFASAWLNSSKNAKTTVLDPYEVEDGWFEIILPSLQLVITDQIPADVRPRAEAMLASFPLRDDERIVRQRRMWYRMYQQRKLTLSGLYDMAPLIARAVEKQGMPAPPA